MRDLIASSSVVALLERYDRPGPRYTSYPTAVEFHAGVGDEQYRQPLHLPFCEARCAFCGCNVVITRHRDGAAAYLDALDQELELLATTVDAFVGGGYRQIGMDHFALPEDELGQAIDRGELHRNFMGYTVQKTHDMVALGVSGIGEVQGAFVQNTKKLPEYYAAVGAGRFAIERGYEMSPDDLLTAAGSPAADGLVTVSGSAIEVTPLGRLFVRNVCMVFDQYLRSRTAGAQPVFSRTV